MSEAFDPYYVWLGIPREEQPPDHYRLLGLRLFEDNPEVIQNAADRQMVHLRSFQSGKRADESQKLLNEVAAARVCLLSPEKKAGYDGRLRQSVGKTLAADLPVATAPPPPPGAPPDLAAFFGHTTSVYQGEPLVTPSRSPWRAAAIVTAVGAVALAVAVFLHQRAVPPGASMRPPGPSAPPTEKLASLEKPPTPPAEKSLPSGRPAGAAAMLTLAWPEAQRPGATVQIDGRPRPLVPGNGVRLEAGQVSLELAPGTHTIDIARPKFRPFSYRGVFAAGQNAVAPVVLTPEVPGDAVVARKKIPPPSPDEQKRLAGQIDEKYKVARARTPAAKAELARSLLKDGRQREANRDEQYALLFRAAEMAREAGEPMLMLDAIEALAAAGFDIRGMDLKTRLLRELAAQPEAAGSAPVRKAMAEACLRLVDDAVMDDAYDAALQVLGAVPDCWKQALEELRKKAEAPATSALDLQRRQQAGDELRELNDLRARLAERRAAVQQVRNQWPAVRAALEKLKSQPDDPEACRTLGRWCCLYAGRWGEGVRLLAKGSEGPLKPLAVKETTSRPTLPADRIALGDAWWDAAQAELGPAKAALLRHAARWYGLALHQVDSALVRQKLLKRLY